MKEPNIFIIFIPIAFFAILLIACQFKKTVYSVAEFIDDNGTLYKIKEESFLGTKYHSQMYKSNYRWTHKDYIYNTKIEAENIIDQLKGGSLLETIIFSNKSCSIYLFKSKFSQNYYQIKINGLLITSDHSNLHKRNYRWVNTPCQYATLNEARDAVIKIIGNKNLKEAIITNHEKNVLKSTLSKTPTNTLKIL